MVLVLTALLASLVAVSMRDPAESRLQQEATRLAALLEGARAESRASGTPVRFEFVTNGDHDFRFIGWPGREAPPQRWLNAGVQGEVVGARALQLGPEPLIGAQRLRLSLDQRQLVLATDGLAPFAIVEAAP